MDPGWLGILPSVPECTYPHCQHILLDGGTGPNTTQYPHSRYLISESNVIKPRGKLWIYYSFIPTNDLSKCFSCFSSLPTGSPYVFRAGLGILPSLPEHSRHLCSSWGHSLRWTPESLFLNLWGKKLASRGINQVLTTCQPFHLQQGARLVTTQYRVQRNQGKHRLRAESSSPVVYLPPSYRRACALASARAPSFRSSCCRWCCPSLVHLDNCGHTLAVRSGRPRRRECILEEQMKNVRKRKESKQIPATLTMKRQNQKVKVYVRKIYTNKVSKLKKETHFTTNFK